MTEVAFHFGATDKWNYLCRLTRKAIARGMVLYIHGPRVVLDKVDVELWNFEATAFIAHCRYGDALQERCPVVLCEQLQAPKGDASWVLINLADTVPDEVDGFSRVIEIVSEDPQDRLQARNRWRDYARRGLPIVRHDLRTRSLA